MVLEKKQLSKKILAVVLSIATMVAFMPMFGNFAYAANETYTLDSPKTIPDQVWNNGELPDLNSVAELAEITVKTGEGATLTLKRGDDYTVKATTGKVTTDASATFTGAGAYSDVTIDPNGFQFSIIDPEATHSYTAEIDQTQFVYSGSALTADAVKAATRVLDNGNTVVDDFTVTLAGTAKDAGDTAKATIKVGDITVLEQNVTISKKNLKDAIVEATVASAGTYDGTAKEPAVSNVTFDGVAAKATDYTVSYSDNINGTTEQKQAKAVITATDACKNYTGSYEKGFAIAPFSLASAYVVVAPDKKPALTYNTKPQKPASLEADVYFANDVQAKKIDAADYTITFEEQTAAGSYAAKLEPAEGTTNVTGTQSIANAWSITQADLKDATITFKDGVTAVPAGVDAAVHFADYFKVMLGDVELAATEYTVSYSKNHSGVVGAESELTITAKPDANVKGSTTKTYTAASKLLATTYKTADTVSFTYNGKAQRPAAADLGTLTAKDPKEGEATSLAATNYIVTDWANNINAGTATATIEGKGDYQGRLATVEFAIAKAPLPGDIAVTGITKGAYYVGQEITGVTVSSRTDTSLNAAECVVTVGEIDAGYMTKVAVAPAENGNYAGAAVSVTLNPAVEADVASLNNAVVTSEIPAGLAEYTPAAIKNFIEVKIDGKVIDPAQYTLSILEAPAQDIVGAKYKVNLTAGTAISGSQEKELTIVQRDIADLEDSVSLAYSTVGYTGEMKEPAVTIAATDYTAALDKDTDFTVAYANNKDAGTAKVTISGKGNYKGTVEKEFTIEKATPTAAIFDFEVASSVDKQFAVGAPKDQKAGIALKAKGTYEISASDYEIALAKKPVQVGTTDPKEEVAATDKVANKITIFYDVKFKESSKNYEAATFENAAYYDLIEKTVTGADITLQNPEIACGAYENIDSLGAITVKVDGAEVDPSFYDASVPADCVTDKVTSELKEGEVAPYVEIVFKDNYAGKAKKDFSIVAGTFDITQLKLVAPTKAEAVYNKDKVIRNYVKVNNIVAGENNVPLQTDKYYVEFTKDGVVLPPDEDGDYGYDHAAIGEYTATLKTTADYGSVAGDTVSFTITKKLLSESEFNLMTGTSLKIRTVEYLGEATKTPELYGNVYADQFEVIEYDKTWDGDTTKKGNAKIALKEDSNYTYNGTADKTFKWGPGTFGENDSPADFYEIADQVYTGKAIEPAVVVKSSSDLSADWAEVLYYSDNTNAAEKTAKAYVKVTIPATETKYSGSFEGWVVFTINPAPIADQTITVAKATYAGKAVTPKVTVKDADGALLTLDKDYTVAYSNNTKAGKGTATITGIKNYTGTTDVQFTIAKGTQKITKVTPAKKTYTANKKTGKLASKKTFKLKATVTPKKGGGKVTFKKANKVGGSKITVAKTGKVTVKSGLAKGTYKVKVKVTKAANKNYKKAVKTVTVQIVIK